MQVPPEEWLERYAAALGLPRDAAVSDDLLDLAGDVAHGTERKNAPLSTYLAGRFVAARMAAGVPESEAVAEALAIVRGLLGD